MRHQGGTAKRAYSDPRSMGLKRLCSLQDRNEARPADGGAFHTDQEGAEGKEVGGDCDATA
jgi:hypothetical protein